MEEVEERFEIALGKTFGVWRLVVQLVQRTGFEWELEVLGVVGEGEEGAVLLPEALEAFVEVVGVGEGILSL